VTAMKIEAWIKCCRLCKYVLLQ